MKRKSIINLALLTLIMSSFVSCSSSSKISTYKIKDIDSFVYLEADDLIELINTRKSFVLVIGEDGCSSCDYIKAPFIEYIKKYNNVVYWIESPLYQTAAKQLENSDYKLKTSILSSTVLIFNKGLSTKEIDYNSNIYFSQGKLDQTLSSYVTNKGYYLINDTTPFKYNDETSMYKIDYSGTSKLDALISSNMKVNVLYSWSRCNNCTELKDKFLDSYILSAREPLYEYEVNYLRNKKNVDGTADLTAFRVFSSKMEFGNYLGGKVPTIVSYDNAKKVDMAVYSNDVIEQKGNSYVVTNSYYEELKNKQSQDKNALHNELINYEFNKIKLLLETK